VHPGGERLTGQDQVRASWAKVLADGSRVRVHISHQVAISGMMIAVHSVQENFSVEGERGRQGTDLRPAPIVATNVYLRTGAGWRMIVHHASPAPGKAEPPRREGSPKILH
jgi:hypothetical protein